MSGLLLRLLAFVFGVSVNSWVRSYSHNTEVGGVVNSRHLAGQAIDVGLGTNRFFLSVVRLLGYKTINESDHIHIEAGWFSELAIFACGFGVVWWFFIRK